MRRTILLFSVTALVLSACGSDGEEAEGPGSTTPRASASAEPADSPTESPTPDPYRTDYDIPPWGELVAMYEYDASEQLDYKVVAQSEEEGVSVYEITYESGGHKVPATFVIPAGSGPFPAVLYAPSNDLSVQWYVPDAIALAGDGYAGLVISSPETRPPYTCFYWMCWKAEGTIKAMTTYVIDALRGIDLLESLPEVDAERVGFVGHAIGGNVGAIIAGIDERVDAYVLDNAVLHTAIPVSMAQWGEGPPASEIPGYQDGVALLNATNYLGHNQNASFLAQFGRADTTSQNGQGRQIYDAISQSKTLRWYGTDVMLACTLRSGGGPCDPSLPAFAFHREWLQENL